MIKICTNLHIDHRYPKSKGGSNTPDNLVTACAECNYGKGDIILETYKLIEKQTK